MAGAESAQFEKIDACEDQMPMTGIEKNMRNAETFPEESGMNAAFNIVTGVMFFQNLPTESKIREMSNIMMTFRRMSAIAQEDGSWEPVDPQSIDWKYHVTTEPSVASNADLSATIDRLGAVALDLDQPPWRVHVVPSSAPAQKSAVVVRVHHCVGDGVHCYNILLAIATKADGSHPENEALNKHKGGSKMSGAAKCQTAVGMCCGALPGLVSSLAAANQSLEPDSAWHATAEARKEGDFSGARAVVLVPPHSLKFVKECKDAAEVSVNDILQAAASGAMRRYCEKRGDPLFEPGEKCPVVFRTLVPVALPKNFSADHDEHDRLTNNFCFGSATLPVGAATALDRVEETNEEMSKLKTSMKPVMAQVIANKIAPLLPNFVIQNTARDLFACHSLVFSNVPGPSDQLFVAGERLEGCQIIFYNAIPQIIVTSYNGKLWMNLTANPEIVTNREWFVQCYFDELKEIGDELGVTSELL